MRVPISIYSIYFLYLVSVKDITINTVKHRLTEDQGMKKKERKTSVKSETNYHVFIINFVFSFDITICKIT